MIRGVFSTQNIPWHGCILGLGVVRAPSPPEAKAVGLNNHAPQGGFLTGEVSNRTWPYRRRSHVRRDLCCLNRKVS